MTTVYQRAGRRIAAWRRSRGWTQERLAEQVGRNASYLARIETGKRKASIDTLEVIVAALGENLEALFAHGSDEDEQLPDGVVSALRGLGEEDLRLLTALAWRIRGVEAANEARPTRGAREKPTSPAG